MYADHPWCGILIWILFCLIENLNSRHYHALVAVVNFNLDFDFFIENLISRHYHAKVAVVNFNLDFDFFIENLNS